MKTSTILLCLMCATAWAFDPAGPPPERTFAWTVRQLNEAIIPAVAFDQVLIADAVLFASKPEVPAAYKVTVKLADEKAVKGKRTSLEARNMKWIDLIAAIAQKADLDLLIEPGSITLVPRAKNASGAKPK